MSFPAAGNSITAAQYQQFKTIATTYQNSNFNFEEGVQWYAGSVPNYGAGASITAAHMQNVRNMIVRVQLDVSGQGISRQSYSAGTAITRTDLAQLYADGWWSYNNYNCDYSECNHNGECSDSECSEGESSDSKYY